MTKKSIKNFLHRKLSEHHIIDLFLHEKSSSNKIDQSFAGEVSAIIELLKSLKIDRGYAVDVAASDGLSQSCTFNLFQNGWSGLCLEMDPMKFSKLAYLYRSFSTVSLSKLRVTPQNINAILKSAEVPKSFDFLNLDIDSYDLFVLEKIIDSGYKPKLISMEINEKIPQDIHFTVTYDENHSWEGDHFYGCSIKAATTLMAQFNYVLVALEWNNAFFAPQILASQNSLKELNLQSVFQSNCIGRNDYLSLFPWNKDVNHWHQLDPDQAIIEIEKFFSKYTGLYELKL
jgi:hypothetical protein